VCLFRYSFYLVAYFDCGFALYIVARLLFGLFSYWLLLLFALLFVLIELNIRFKFTTNNPFLICVIGLFQNMFLLGCSTIVRLFLDMFMNFKFYIWWPYFIIFFQITKIGKREGVMSYLLEYPDYPDQSMFFAPSYKFEFSAI
jgi:hypothetical protein